MKVALGVFTLAAATRAIYLAIVRPPFEGHYVSVARNLSTHGFLGLDGVPTAAFEPLYPWFVYATQRLVGDHPLGIQIVQLSLDALGAVGLYFLAAALTAQRRVALIAAVLYAIYPLLIRHAVGGGESVLLSVLLIGFAYALVAGQTVRHAAIAGVALGLAILTRSVAAPLLIVAAIALVAQRRPLAAIVFTVATMVAVSPWLLHNYALNGSIWATRAGLNLLQAQSRYAEAILPEYNIDLLGTTMDTIAGTQPELLDPSRELELDQYYAALAVQEMRSRPLRAVRLFFAKLAYFLWPRLVPSQQWNSGTTIEFRSDGTIAVRNGVPRPVWEHLGYSLSYTPVALAAVAGIWLRRRIMFRDWVLWSILSTFAAVYAVYFPATRFRAPVEFVLLFYAAVAAAALHPRRSGHSPSCD